MYHIHTTLGVITHSTPHGEANRLLSIFTKDLGMVRAHAQGVRLAASKLKGHITSYSLKEFSLVRGKEIWRLTSIKDVSDSPAQIINHEARQVCTRILGVLSRLVTGEEAHAALFIHVEALMQELSVIVAVSESAERLEAVELLTVLRVLYELGYIEKTEQLEPFLAGVTFSPELLAKAVTERSRITHSINSAFQASHL